MSQNAHGFLKRMGLVVLIITTILLASCPPPNQPDPPPGQGSPNTPPAAPVPPAAPTKLQFTIGDDEVTLTWKEVTGAASYRIYRDGGRIAADINITAFTYTDTDVTNGTPYVYTVRALDADGRESDLSTPVTAIPSPDDPPPAPTGLGFTIGDGEVTLIWNVVADASSYHIYRDGRLIDTIIISATSITASYTDSGLENDIAYEYTVQALDISNLASDHSDSVTATPTAPEIPAPAPAPLAAPDGLRFTTGNDEVTLTWNEVAGATRYQVYRDGTPIGTPTADRVYADMDVSNGTPYVYTVRALDDGGRESDHSRPGTATPTAPPVPADPADPLTAPDGLGFTTGNRTVTLTWNAVAGATRYQVYRDGDLRGTPTADRFYTDTGLNNDTAYEYTVRALDDGGRESDLSTPITATPTAPVPGPAPPPPPVPLAAPEGLRFTTGNRTVTLTWGEAAGATRYQVYRDDTARGTPTADRFYTDTGLDNDTAYEYTVRALDDGGRESDHSLPVTATPTAPLVPVDPAAPPAAPEGLGFTTGNRTVTLTWNEVAGALDYQVYRNGEPIGAPVADRRLYTDTGLDNDVSYRYTVRARDNNGLSGDSLPVTATPTAPEIPDIPAPAAPPAPTNLQFIAGNGVVTLSWNAAAGAARYQVYRNGEPIGTPVTDRFYPDTGLDNDVSYSYTVRAIDDANRSSIDSRPVTATPTAPPAPPAAPEGLGFTIGDGEVTLTWTAVDDATSYRVYRNGERIAFGVLINRPSYPDNTANIGVEYSYTVRARNNNGLSGDSLPVTVTLTAPDPDTRLAAPTGLSFTVGDRTVTLTWEAVTDAARYQVYRDGEIRGVPIPGLSYPDTGLTNGTPYSYTVRAIDDANRSSIDSLPVTATPAIPPPAAPGNFEADGRTGVVMLTWNAPTGAATYNVYRRVGDADPEEIATGLTDPSYPDNNDIVRGTAYIYTVQAVNINGDEGPHSDEATGNPPTLSPVFGVMAGNDVVELNWVGATGAARYNVYRMVGGAEPVNIATGLTGLSHIDNDVENNTEYTYVVLSVGDNGAESIDIVPKTATPAAPPAAPTDLAFTIGDGMVTLTWREAAGAARYQVYRDGEVRGAPIPAPGLTSTDTGQNGTEYLYTVRAVNRNGLLGPPSNEVRATPTDGPDAPDGFRFTTGDTEVALAWREVIRPEVARATGYNVYRMVGDADPVQIATGLTDPSYRDTDVTNRMTYSYRVQAVDALGRMSSDSILLTATPAVLAEGDFGTLPISANDSPTGIWSNGEIMWVANDGRADSDSESKIFAYNRMTGARISDLDFNPTRPGSPGLSATNTEPTALWSNLGLPVTDDMGNPIMDAMGRPTTITMADATLWVANTSAGRQRLYAYGLASKERRSSMDSPLLRTIITGFPLPTGIWSDGTTMWIAHEGGRRVYAFTMGDTTDDWARDTAREFTVPGGTLGGIWGNDDTIWVASNASNRIYAFNKTDPDPDIDKPSRDMAKDIDLGIAGNNSPTDIWSDGTTMWVADKDDDKIFAYNLIDTANGGRGTRDETKDVGGLNTEHDIPYGLWSNGATMWVGNNNSIRSDGLRLYAYNLEDKTRIGNDDFLRPAFRSTGANPPIGGFWSNGRTMWVADRGRTPETIRAFDMMTMEHDADKDIPRIFDSGNQDPAGLWSDNYTMWVSDINNGRIYAYNLFTGVRDPEKEFFQTLNDIGNTDPAGIWSNGETMWVVDATDKKIFAYNMSNKERDPGKDFSTAVLTRDTDAPDPVSIWSNGTTMWVLDSGDDRIYAYDLATQTYNGGP